MENSGKSGEKHGEALKEAEDLAKKISELEERLVKLRMSLPGAGAEPEIDGAGLEHDEPPLSPSEGQAGLGLIEQTQSIINMLTSGAEAGFLDRANQANGLIGRMEDKIAILSRKAESVMDLQLTLEEIGKKLETAANFQKKLDAMALSAAKLGEKVWGIEEEAGKALGMLHDAGAVLSRVESAAPGITDLLNRLEEAGKRGQKALEVYAGGAELTSRLKALLEAGAERETKLSDAIRKAELSSGEYEILFQIKKRAGKFLEKAEAAIRESERILERNQQLEASVSGRIRKIESYSDRLERVEEKASQILSREDSIASVELKMDRVTGSMETLDNAWSAIRGLEDKIRSIAMEFEGLKDGLDAAKKRVLGESRLKTGLDRAEARLEDITAQMESAEARLATASAMQRNLSIMEDKAFQIARKLDALEEQGKSIGIVQERASQLRELLGVMEKKLDKLIS